MFLFYFLIFVFGTAIGSFLGVIVDRMASNEPIWKGRSHCDHCRHTLHPLDLIPIFSYLFLERKCRYCHKELNWFYPFIEACTGLAFVAAASVIMQSGIVFYQLQFYIVALYYIFLISSLLVIFFTDWRYGIIPFRSVGFALVVTFLLDLALPFLPLTLAEKQLLGLQTNLLSILGSAIGAGGFFLILFAGTKGRGMGFGDVVYAFLMGFTLGFPGVLLGLYLAFVSGAIISLILVAMKKKRFKGGTIPFGPFLVLGTIISLLWGNSIIVYLLHLLS
jgi:leader peptidase (prepilin peptidase) / N-methyltransferase